jgi:hypothetical protein
MANNGPSTVVRLASPSALAAEPVPPLENGDRLTADEFMRRYSAMPEINKAQLIEGVVYMPSPVKQRGHGGQHFDLNIWLGLYRISTPGVEGGDNSTLQLDLENVPQPDAFLFVQPDHGGRVRIDDEGYVIGGPELVGEVSATSVSIDLGDKFKAYRRNGVCEYIVWRVFDRAIDWFILRGDRYDRLALDNAGIYRSETFPGLWLDAAALVAGDMAAVARVAQQGIATPEHAAFVANLQQRAASLKQ